VEGEWLRADDSRGIVLGSGRWSVHRGR
jgi:hypothetical protein